MQERGGLWFNVIYVGDYTGAEQGTISNGLNDGRDVYEKYGPGSLGCPVTLNREINSIALF